MSDNVNFVTVTVSRKQVITANPYHSDKTDKDYARVLTPDGGSFIYPIDSLKFTEDKPDEIFFSRPEGTEIMINYSKRKDGVPDDAPNEEKYENFSKTVKIEDLEEMYRDARREYAEAHSEYVNMQVPLSWGDHFESKKDGKGYVSVSILVPEGDGQGDYWNFVMPEERFLTSKKDDTMAYFGFPRMKKDEEGNVTEQPYEINLQRDIKNQATGEYDTLTKTVTSMELKGYVEAAVENYKVKNMFVSTVISEKLIRPFTSKDGTKNLYDVSVPVKEGDKEEFYHIVVPEKRVSIGDNGRARISLFKNDSDGQEYTFTAKKSVLQENGEYMETSMKLTSAQVIDNFTQSKENYKKNAPRVASLGDSVKEEKTEATDESMGEGFQPTDATVFDEAENVNYARSR